MDIKKRILDGLASDPTINARGITLYVSRKGFLDKKKVLKVYGTVSTGAQKDRILRLAQKQAGEDYEIMDDLFVSELLWDG